MASFWEVNPEICLGRGHRPTTCDHRRTTCDHDSLGIHRGGPRKTVELLFDPEVAVYVEEHFWHHTEQFGIADDGRLLLTKKVAINPELEGKIRKWTPNVEVINPPELRDSFRQHASKEYDRYH